MDIMNSQPKSSNASVGTNQPIELPQSNEGRKKHKRDGGSPRQGQAFQAHDHNAEAPQDEPVRRSRGYYDDSDDMIERVRRVRAAFEKRINGFQGADWPYYVKRTIVGKKKTGPPSANNKSAVAPDDVEPKTALPTLPSPSDTRKEHA